MWYDISETDEFILDYDIKKSILENKEIWLDVVLDKGRKNLFNKYQVSSHGRVRDTLHDNKIIPQFDSNRHNNSNQYWQRVALYYNKDTYFKISVHRLVALAFIGKPEDERMEVNHKDGNPENNHVSNLEWVTRNENMQHAFDNNLVTVHRGSKRSNSIFTENDVEIICGLMKDGYKAKAILKIMQSKNSISNKGITREQINHLMKHLRKGTHWFEIAEKYGVVIK